MNKRCTLPTWAPRVPQHLIRRLYESDAKGIYDEDLINEVGYALLVRCESFIAANRARAGEVACPLCGKIVPRQEVLRCDCGWELPWAAYFKTIQHKQLSGAEPVLSLFREYVANFPRSRSLQEKMIHIDILLHGFHWGLNEPTRPVAVNLIQGRLQKVVAFLDGLTYGDQHVPGAIERRAEWRKNLDIHPDWYAAARAKSGSEA